MKEKVVRSSNGMLALLITSLLLMVYFAGIIAGGIMMDDGMVIGIPVFTASIILLCILRLLQELFTKELKRTIT